MSDNLPVHPDSARFVDMEKVMSLYAKNTSVPQIARQVGITQKAVRDHIKEWRASAVGSEFLRERTDDLMVLMDEHFSVLIQEGWKTLSEVDDAISGEEGITAAILGARTAAIKAIADLEAKRIETLQKAGLLEAADLGDELAEMEDNMAKVVKILEEVSFHCPNCKMEVAKRLSSISGQAVGVEEPIDGEVID